MDNTEWDLLLLIPDSARYIIINEEGDVLAAYKLSARTNAGTTLTYLGTVKGRLETTELHPLPEVYENNSRYLNNKGEIMAADNRPYKELLMIDLLAGASKNKLLIEEEIDPDDIPF